MIDDIPVSNNNGSSSTTNAIIGGVVGGVILLLMIILLMCVILCMRRCNASPVDDKKFNQTTKINTNVNIEDSPAYDVTKASSEDYIDIKPGDSDIPMTTNPSYGVPAKLCRKPSVDECGYVQPNEFIQHTSLEGSIEMDTNPSYGVHTANNGLSSNEREYDAVNQSRCNDTDYEITHVITTSQQTDAIYI